MKKLILFLAIAFISSSAFSQYRMGLVPRESPMKKISNTIGYTEVEVQYSSPAVKKRKIWGDLVAYDKIWRAGANEATKLTFSKSVTIKGNKVPAGSYSLFVIPREDDPWTIIFNKDPEQWGAFSYNESEDLFRIEVLPRFNVNYQEDLTYEIKDLGHEFGIVRMLWENIELDIEFNRELLPDLLDKIETTVSASPETEHWVIYLQGAEFFIYKKKHLDLAYEWLEKSTEAYKSAPENIKSKSSYYQGHLYWLYSKYYQLKDNNEKAIYYWDKMKKMDSGKGFFNRGIGKEKAMEYRETLGNS